ncbi:MAG: transcriptional repressor [Sphingobacteriales bacterium]|nr:MAG: transcriptional repressor [Sphingobacteriales bacterium]
MKRRNTASKDAVLDLLTNTRKAMSQDAIERQVTVPMDRVTVYRVLNRFCEDGLVHKIVADDGKQYFAACLDCKIKPLPKNHFHFRCLKCDTIECLNYEVTYAAPKNYKVERVNCLLTGYCGECA